MFLAHILFVSEIIIQMLLQMLRQPVYCSIFLMILGYISLQGLWILSLLSELKYDKFAKSPTQKKLNV